MKFNAPLIVVEDMERAVAFYRAVLGVRKTMDFGANVTLTGGFSLQTKESYARFLGVKEEEIRLGGRDAELYFEEADFDGFLKKIEGMELEYVHPVQEHDWGQRAVRFYDPDRHIIEVGEEMKAVCRRFFERGMSVAEVRERTMLPEGYIRRCKK